MCKIPYMYLCKWKTIYMYNCIMYMYVRDGMCSFITLTLPDPEKCKENPNPNFIGKTRT